MGFVAYLEEGQRGNCGEYAVVTYLHLKGRNN